MEFKHNGFTVKIEQDEMPESPRDWDNLGKMICFHKRYNLGDKHDYNSKDYAGWNEMKKAIEAEEKAAVILPLYLMDHSGLTMKIDSGLFQAWDRDGWDWGQVGFIVVSREAVHKEYSVKKITSKISEFARKVLEGEVETYNQYLAGDVWGYVITDKEGKDVDSCWNFYGQNYCENEAKEVCRTKMASAAS